MSEWGFLTLQRFIFARTAASTGRSLGSPGDESEAAVSSRHRIGSSGSGLGGRGVPAQLQALSPGGDTSHVVEVGLASLGVLRLLPAGREALLHSRLCAQGQESAPRA